jgi:predicted enzyme related to lactoylglutathione lyase
MTSDTAKAVDFYTQLFGWEADEPNEEFGGYINFNKDGARIAGCMAGQPGMPDLWSIYLASDDAAKTAEVAKANGGSVMLEPAAVGEFGTFAFLIDSSGAGIGVWEPKAHPGFRVFGEANTPSWFELHTRDYDAAVDFYRNVFRWDTHSVSDTAEFRYTTLGGGDSPQLAGIMDASAFLPEGVPSHWSVYFGVDDTDATLSKINQLGGSTVQPAEDTPYGRLATAVDSTGAQFKLVAPNEAMPARDSSS